MPRETRVIGCETRREGVSAELGNGHGSVALGVIVRWPRSCVHLQAAMSVGESDAFGALSGLWLRSQAETESPRRNGERQGGKQRREAVLLSARSKSSKGAERSGESRRCPSEPLTAWKQDGTGVGEPEGRVHTGNRGASRHDRNAVNLGSEIGLQHARGCRKPQSAVVVRNHESSA
jgi:hypothetical protein